MKEQGRILIALLFILTCARMSPALAQTFEENLLYGDEAAAEMDFYTASVYYHNALELDSSSMKASWKYAEACRQFNNYSEAVKYYTKVLERDNNNRYPLCRFWLAWMQKSTGDYVSAAENFSIYKEANEKQNDFYTQKAAVEVPACTGAPAIIEKPLDISIEHLLDAKVNTDYSEFNALQLGDTALIFSALRPIVKGELDNIIPNTYASRLYIAQATQAGWSRVKELETRINATDYHNANVTISSDHKRMYFTRSKVENNPGLKTSIWFTENVNGKWKKPVKLDARINSEEYTSTHPALAEFGDHDVLYFVSDRPGGFGKLDIWYSILKNGKYSDPVNLGSIINSPGDEITPFYSVNRQTLYFSSDWHPGLGSFDIFSSQGALNQWKKPENTGYPLNTGYNDIYFTINTVDNDGYFTSNRPGSLFIKSETCCNDIYYYEWRPEQRKEIIEQIEEKDTADIETSIKKLLPLTLYFHNDEPDPRSTATSTKKNYKTTLSEYYDLKYLYKTEYSRGLSGNDKIKAEQDIEDFFETYVGYGFSQLKLFSQLLLLDLEQGNRVEIVIKGFCSPLHSTEYNVNLAKRRISSLKNYIFKYNEGVFLPYLDGSAENGGKLQLQEDPIGESLASPFVSDNPNDKKNSIYSRAAAFERKIQIILYESEKPQMVEPELKEPEITFADTVYDFGTHTQGEKVMYKFRFTNTGKRNLIITGAEPSCDCTQVNWPGDPIPPGGAGSIDISIDTKEEEGSYELSATIFSNTLKTKTTLLFPIHVTLPGKQKK